MIVIDILVYIGFWAMVYGTYCLFRRTPRTGTRASSPRPVTTQSSARKCLTAKNPYRLLAGRGLSLGHCGAKGSAVNSST